MKELEKLVENNVKLTRKKVIFNREFWEKTMEPALDSSCLIHDEYIKLSRNKRELYYFLKQRIEDTTSKSKKVIYEEILSKIEKE